MLRIKITCDFCGNEIVGEFRKVRQEFTDTDTAGVRTDIKDMCMDCLKMVTDYKRVPLFSDGDIKDAAL